MKLILQVIKQKPNSVETIQLEDVSSYEVTDNKIIVKFNGSPDEVIALRDLTSQSPEEWFALSTFATRIGLTIDMNS